MTDHWMGCGCLGAAEQRQHMKLHEEGIDEHNWQPREINARLIRASCSCGWGARQARTSVVRAIGDHDQHVGEVKIE